MLRTCPITDEHRLTVVREIWSFIRERGAICGFAALWAYGDAIKARTQVTL
jgi:hypothetical protein